MQIRAAVARDTESPFTIEKCELSSPGRNEILVRIVASGICHTDVAAKLQQYPAEFPVVLGHEGAGIVEAVGEDVDGVEPGDAVLMSYASCGECELCNSGDPSYCLDFVPLNFPGLRKDGSSAISQNGQTIGGHFFNQSSFATHCITSVRNVTKVAPDLPLEILAPLGCGIQTGAGAVLLTFGAKPGSSIAVFGTGSVGLAAIMAAKIAGCETIIAVDTRQSRLELASELGATHTLGAAADTVGEIIELSRGGVNYSFDTTGVPEVCTQAFQTLRSRGTAGYVAANSASATMTIDLNALIITGRTVKGIIEGDAWPPDFLPRLVDYYRSGQLPLEKLVTRYPLENINEAINDMHSGHVVKPILLMK